MGEPKKEWHSHPAVGRYDKRHGNGQLERERQQVRELRSIRRKQRKLIKWLEDASENSEFSQGLIAAKRLLAELYDKERDRIEGRPHTATPPPKPATSDSSGLQDAIQKLVFSGEKVNPTAERIQAILKPTM